MLSVVLVSWSQSKVFKNVVCSLSRADSWLSVSAFPDSKSVKTQASRAAIFPGFLSYQVDTLSTELPLVCEERKPGWIAALEDWVSTPLLQSIWKQLIHVENARLILQDILGWKPYDFRGGKNKYHKWIRPISENYTRLRRGNFYSFWLHADPTQRSRLKQMTVDVRPDCPVVPSVMKNGRFKLLRLFLSYSLKLFASFLIIMHSSAKAWIIHWL